MSTEYFVGIDVSKDTLDVCVYPTQDAFRVPNSPDGLDELIKRLKAIEPRLIVFEATGGYETLAVSSLAAAGLAVVVVNPRQIRDFAKSIGRLAKTDVIDAAVIARFASAVRPELRPVKDSPSQELTGLVTRRRQIVDMMMSEIKNGKLKGLIARSADFYGPHNAKSMLQETVFKNLKKGKRPNWMIDADKLHSFTYTPDAAKAVAVLGNTPDTWNQVWHMPTSAEKLTARQIIDLFNKEMGTAKKVQVLPLWMLKLLGLFIPILREMPEMMYQNDRDYFFDSSKFNNRFSFTPTSYAQGVKKTVAAG